MQYEYIDILFWDIEVRKELDLIGNTIIKG